LVDSRRDYGQFCGLAAGLNIVGERWTFLILRELLFAPMRFNGLLENLPGIGPNLLAARLRMLTEHKVIEQLAVPGDSRGRQYKLSEVGEQLRTPVLGLAKWGLQFLTEADSKKVVRDEWGFLAIQSMIIEEHIPADVSEVYEFRVGDHCFTIEVDHATVEFRSGSAPLPDLTISCDAYTFISIGAGMLTPFDAIVTGDVKVDGDPEVIHRCTRMLGLAG